MTEPAPPPLTADELDAQLAWHAAGCGYCENSDSPCMYSRTIATAAALRTQLEQAQARLEADAAHFEMCTRMRNESTARETALREALEDCLHRLGNMWTYFNVPLEDWPRLKEEAALGVGRTETPNSGAEYSWKLNWIAFQKGRAALSVDMEAGRA